MAALCAAAVGVSPSEPSDAAGRETPPLPRVSRAELRQAMARCTGYDPAATTNGARFQGEVLLTLARSAVDRDADGPPLTIDHEDWFQAFLETTGLTPQTAPQYAVLARRHGQDLQLEPRYGRVVRRMVDGPAPEVAANVKIFWPDRDGGPERYAYDDTLSSPRLRVTNHRTITYRLLSRDGVVYMDEIEGLTGRPTSGILGLLFELIGEGRVVWSRMVIADDGLQVARASARKGFLGRTATVTVHPDGRTEEGTPSGRPDLEALARRLEGPLRVDYVPYGWAE